MAIAPHNRSDTSTIVTPFVKGIFTDMGFASLLVTAERDLRSNAAVARRRSLLKLTPVETLSTGTPTQNPNTVEVVSPNEVVYIKPDVVSPWKTLEKTWIALVQDVRTWKSGRTKLDLIWLYRPSDTSIGKSYYPFDNELFLSDNCSCGSDAYDLEDVLGKVNVSFGGTDPIAAAKRHEYIVRQTYLTEAHEFVTLDEDHFACNCKDSQANTFAEAVADYKEGDFVLYRKGNLGKDSGIDEDNLLEPGQVMGFVFRTYKLRLRILQRAQATRQSARANELVWTEQYIDTPAFNMVRPCRVQGFALDETLPDLFTRGGAGDLFFYWYQAEDPNKHRRPSSPDVPKLRAMGICCGGGSFDRGLEDGGSVKFVSAIDYDTAALHTYRANTDAQEMPQMFLGPMEKYLEDELQASDSTYEGVAIGDIDVIVAGSPCQSFSALQPDKESPRSVKHASLIACVLSYVEHYMPLYFYLENVVSISSATKGLPKDQNMLRKIIATLVALGYQVQQNVLDAPSYGSFQSRRRVIVTATAPGLNPPVRPPQSHLSKPEDELFRVTHLGSLMNGRPFGSSQDELAPFRTVTFNEGTKDLPDIGDGHTYTCIPFPDHRQGGARLSYNQRTTIRAIPQYPRGMGLASAHEAGKIAEPQVKRWLSNKTRAASHSKAFSRVRPDSLINTITTAIHALDAFNGTCLHPNQNRLLTVMEARRAQGFPDHEVILGGREQQWKIIGNSVHRNVAFALGLSLKDAWQKTCAGDSRLVQTLKQQILQSTSAEGAKKSELSSEVAMDINRDIEQDMNDEQPEMPVSIRARAPIQNAIPAPKAPRNYAPHPPTSRKATASSTGAQGTQQQSRDLHWTPIATPSGWQRRARGETDLPNVLTDDKTVVHHNPRPGRTSEPQSVKTQSSAARSTVQDIPIRAHLSPSVASADASLTANPVPSRTLHNPDSMLNSTSAIQRPRVMAPTSQPQSLVATTQPTTIMPPSSSQSSVPEEEQTVTEETTTTVVTTTTTTVKKVIKTVRRGSGDATEEVTTVVTTG